MSATSLPDAPAMAFVVIVFQPAQVRAYARFRLQRAKNDKIDAGLVADLHGGDRDRSTRRRILALAPCLPSTMTMIDADH